jgi:hypothetical protein
MTLSIQTLSVPNVFISCQMIYHNLFVILAICADYYLFKMLHFLSSNVQEISYNAKGSISGCYCTSYESIHTHCRFSALCPFLLELCSALIGYFAVAFSADRLGKL